MSFAEKIRDVQPDPLRSREIAVLQVNVGYRCTLSCKHCHLDAGPGRGEEMSKGTVESVIRVLGENSIEALDITGGAPELNPYFTHLVSEAKKLSRRVIVRTNLTIFAEKGKEGLPAFYKDNEVELVASLPYYSESSVNRMRGEGVFSRSIQELKKLNSLGYGRDQALKLHLVYNPQGAFLAPAQKQLEEDYKRELAEKFGIIFNQLFAFANMPLGRFKEFLVRSGNYASYCEKLKSAFNPSTLEGLMCRHLVSVGWDGTLYDCDFNQSLGIPVNSASSHIDRFEYKALLERTIATGEHCYGCTAGQGST